MTVPLSHFMRKHKSVVEQELKKWTDQLKAPSILIEAMDYSLMAGGKRIRPIFLLATIDALGKDVRTGYTAASSIEMIHTYSLIHDDLPAMDDDDYRRGKRTNHKVFGEAMAILAGDALLTHAFYVMSQVETDSKIIVRLIQELSALAGASGMVGGQVADLLGEKRDLSLSELQHIHQHKTADLLICSVRSGAMIAEATEEQLQALTEYAQHIGLAFQIQDDILDEIGDEQKLGKAVGSDRQNGKSTFVSLVGIEQAKQEVEKHVNRAKASLQQAQVKTDLLSALSDFMIQRDK